MKVLLSNYQAEYGRMSGGNVQLVTKSGTRDFHGIASWFKRHEQFNANSFFNNQQGLPKGRYRYNTYTYNIGGPVVLPALKFNRDRDKLFFFFHQEFWPTQGVAGGQVTVPTALERQDAETMITAWGGLIVPDLSGDVDFLVLGERPVLPPRPGADAPLEVVQEFIRRQREV
ncbi:MAG: hypothetical protein JNL62_30330, partial [Bryobacterales bacterium]|nr:hypothetical protein [Bryobacterales bacterium]